MQGEKRRGGVGPPDPTRDAWAELAEVFASAPVAQGLVGPAGTWLKVNRALCRLLGREEQELLGEDVAPAMAPEDRARLVERLDHLLAGRRGSLLFDGRVLTGDGFGVWCTLALAPLETARGRRVVFQALDISNRRSVELLLRNSEQRYRNIFNALAEGYWEVDADGITVDVNDTLCAMTGLKREQIVNRPARETIAADGLASFDHNLDLRRRTATRSYETVLKRRDGSGLAVQMLSTTLTDGEGGFDGSFAIVVDISTRKAAEISLRASEQRYLTLVQSLQDALVLIRKGRFEFANEAFARLIGRPAEEIPGMSAFDMFTPTDARLQRERHRRRLAGQPMEPEYEIQLRRWDRSLDRFEDKPSRWVRVHIADRLDGDTVIGTLRDVTEAKRIEADLRKLSRAIEQSPVGVIITNAQGVIEYANPKFLADSGYEHTEVIGATPRILRSGLTPPDVIRQMWLTIQAGQPWRCEFQNRRKTGELYWDMTLVQPIRDPEGRITHFVAIKEDITARKQADRQVWEQANFDAITRLPNRILFTDRLGQALMRARRTNEEVAVVFIDLDRFKAVNDTLGHEAGDELLVAVAQRLTESVRESDTVARLAGDEFTLILPSPGSHADLVAVVRRVLESLRAPFHVAHGREVLIGGSLGVALYPRDGDSTGELIRNADTAMYRAKESGRNAYRFFEPTMNAEMVARTNMETDLRRAVAARQIEVHFQPMVDASGKAVIGAEALVRWVHPTAGPVPPAEFLPIAEEIGLGPDIGHIVLDCACRQAAAWRALPGREHLFVSVNVATRQLMEDDLATMVATALDEHGLPPDALVLEFGEKVLLHDGPAIEGTLLRLAAQGVRLAIDDFGTAAASLRRLKRFPFALLKVDRSFIRDILEEGDGALLVEAMVAMARKLKLGVVAEGVETEAQLKRLSGQSCDMFQGFLFGPPLPPAAFGDLLAKPPRD
ncbi:PAS domain S-box protein [Roseospirillum parvum]|uniref:PAS domain S-box-containing protein/diguanylate cyclase (GGDEF) domain-containing protein n=1 Tax=Roseospirillum parvum TaxID=83401 RepID=A0A1G7Z7Y2_9PROT|nr:PAS domain S-box protein [Roseospirillum parvum]SDH04230.1 PAS domain S-box-containing protein/diguanylate cyclase (GGDEF) domain-containing protein [Roseospirillum parvum]